jgi:copper chaperone
MDRRTETMTIAGMSCGHCVAAVRRALGDIDGVEVRDVSVGAAEIAYDPGTVDRGANDAAIEDAGFSVVGAPAS